MWMKAVMDMMAVMWMMAVMDMMDTFGHSQKKAPGAENAGGLGTEAARTLRLCFSNG